MRNIEQIDPDLPALMDRLLLAHGSYVPVELLLAEGKLRYPDYEAWRGGEISTLEGVFQGDPRQIFNRLRQAADWAGKLGLTPEPQEYLGWGNNAGGKRLRLSQGDPGREKLLCTHYARAKPVGQGDLFLDSGATPVLNELVAALAGRQPDRAEGLLGRLGALEPDHHLRTLLEMLCAALRDLNTPRHHEPAPDKLMARLDQHLVPVAKAALGNRARDFLSPFRRQLAAALQGRRFDPAHPKLHSSWVHGQLLDWEGVRNAILTEPDWVDQPCLLGRLAEASCHLDERGQAIGLWSRLCWQEPGAAAGILSDPGLVDLAVRRMWREFLDLDSEPVEGAPLGVADFPAWLLIREPGLVHVLAAEAAPAGTAAGRAFRALHVLISAEAAGAPQLDDEALRWRAALGEAHPVLLALYLEYRVKA